MSVTPPDPGRISFGRVLERLRLDLADLEDLAAQHPELASEVRELRALVDRLQQHHHRRP
jgi:CRP-like cAMP-binding protein